MPPNFYDCREPGCTAAPYSCTCCAGTASSRQYTGIAAALATRIQVTAHAAMGRWASRPTRPSTGAPQWGWGAGRGPAAAARTCHGSQSVQSIYRNLPQLGARVAAPGLQRIDRLSMRFVRDIGSRLDAHSRPQRRRHRIRFAFLTPFVLSPLGPPFPPNFFFFFPAFSLSPVASLLSLLLLLLFSLLLLCCRCHCCSRLVASRSSALT